ncbi:MAG: alpha-ketoglutarate permease [Legionella sp.]|nr:MAG: alpha-ketoglutarate permease [Legionella sp.]PJD98988.1 MAG: alpha-ketoglutarate permease [Legionella sp.]
MLANDDLARKNNKQHILSIIGASSGNLVEWFDFYIYSFCAIYFAPSFFPSSDPTTQLLNTAGVFAVGFFMRPIGGWFLGRLADRKGRRSALIASVLMMCLGSLMIAFLPTYQSIGIAAPTLLVVARLLQGLSVGGEYGTSATYMSEIAKEGRKGFFTSFQYVTLIGGQLSAVLALVGLQYMLTNEQLYAWGWRIPFVLGAFAAIIALFLRRSMKETVASQRKNKNAGSLKALMQHKTAFLTVVSFTAGGSLVFYTFTTYMQKYLVNTVGLELKTASMIMTCALFIFMVIQPLFGALSDRIGRRNSMIWFGALTTLFTIPIMHTLGNTTNPYIAFALVLTALILISFYTSISGLIKAEFFPSEIRALGVGLSYAFGNAIFGGSAEFVALKFKSLGMESSFYCYVTLLCAFVFFVALFMRDPDAKGFLNKEQVSM